MLFGSASSSWGVRRLLKALRHEAPGAASGREPPRGQRSGAVRLQDHPRLDRPAGSVPRAWRQRSREGSELKADDGEHARVGSLFKVQGEKTQKVGEARDGDVVAVAKIERVKAGEWLGAGKLPPPVEVDYPARNCAIAIEPADRKDDVKLSGALQRLAEEDAALVVEHDDANHEIRLRGVNDEHLNTVVARLKRRYGVEVKSHAPTVGYRESIRKPVTQKGRHKKQSGGHGQFGDVIIEVKPLPRGSGFRVRREDPRRLGAQAMDPGGRGRRSRSDAQRAARLPGGRLRGDADRRQLSQRRQFRARVPPCRPDRDAGGARRRAAAPARADAQADRRLPIERDQPDHFGGRRAARPDARHGAARRLDRLGPDRRVDPGSRAVGLEAELRSQSQGLATYEAEFDHLAELNGPLADKVIQQRVPEPA